MNFISCKIKTYVKTLFFSSAMQLGDEEDSDIVFYIMLRAADRFFEEYSRFPGWYNDQVEGDVYKLKVSSILMKGWKEEHLL